VMLTARCGDAATTAAASTPLDPCGPCPTLVRIDDTTQGDGAEAAAAAGACGGVVEEEESLPMVLDLLDSKKLPAAVGALAVYQDRCVESKTHMPFAY
jgi:hypothetical protein